MGSHLTRVETTVLTPAAVLIRTSREGSRRAFSPLRTSRGDLNAFTRP